MNGRIIFLSLLNALNGLNQRMDYIVLKFTLPEKYFFFLYFKTSAQLKPLKLPEKSLNFI